MAKNLKNSTDVKDVSLTINVFPIEEPQSSTRAFASVAVDDLIAIRGIRVVDGEKGLFVSMPQSKNEKTGEFHDIAFPLNGELRKAISEAILDKYAAEKGVKRDSHYINKTQIKKQEMLFANKDYMKKWKKTSLNVRVAEGKKRANAQPKRSVPVAAKSKSGTSLE